MKITDPGWGDVAVLRSRLALAGLGLLLVGATLHARFLTPGLVGRPVADTTSSVPAHARRFLAEWAYVRADSYFVGSASPGLLGRLFGAEDTCGTGPAGDWIARLGRHFRPHGHEHMGERPGDAPLKDQLPELIPWLWLGHALDPANTEVAALFAFVAGKGQGTQTMVEGILRTSLRHAPGDPQLLLALGDELRRQDRWGQAREVWRAAWATTESRPSDDLGQRLWLQRQLVVRLEEVEGRLDGPSAAGLWQERRAEIVRQHERLRSRPRGPT